MEILEQTKLSLEEVGRQYLEQRRYIEQQLERRRQLKLKGSIQFFLRKVFRQSHTDVTSFCMQFEKIGRWLLREAFVSRKRGGK